MKNTEWGAVAYLSHSKYGTMNRIRINNNSNYVTGYASVKEPTCGYTGKNETCNQYGTESSVTQPWNTSAGYLASTTGNISGVYDMSGGAWEYMMGVMVDKNGKNMSGRNSLENSGFNGAFGCPTCENDPSGLTSLTTGKDLPLDSRYYNTYSYAETNDIYQHRILGDATGELGPFYNMDQKVKKVMSWYLSDARFVYTWNPWFIRGGHFNNGSDANILGYSNHYGHAYMPVSYRIVLTM